MNQAGFLFNIHFLNEFEELERKRELQLYCRTLRDASDPFTIPETNFRKLYHIPKRLVFDIIIPKISTYLYAGVRSTYIPIHIRSLAVLHFLAQGSYQSSCSKDLHVAISQPALSRCINEIIDIFTNNLLPEYVKFPTQNNDIRRVKEGFLENFRFPDVIGAIDCTHVAIISPPVEHPTEPAIAFLNRKGYFSINVQGICDSNLIFLSINARYPGATHDAAIWQMSSVNAYLRRKYEAGQDNLSWLLGDSGYPLQPWLLTPIPDAPENSPEGRFTKRHCSARNVVERCFGVLKQRFRCLLKHRVLHYNATTAGKIIYTCVVLHNICRANMDDILDEEDDNEIEENNEENRPEGVQGHFLAEGRRIRNRLINRFELEG